MYKQDGLLFGGRMSDFAEGWHTPDGDAVAIPGSVKTDANGTARMVNTLPSSLPAGAVLSLRSTYQTLDVKIDGSSVYSWSLFNKAPFINAFGLSSYLIKLPASAAGRTIELILASGRQGGGVSVYSVTLADGIAAPVSMVNRSLFTVALFFLLVFLFVLVSATAIAVLILFTAEFIKYKHRDMVEVIAGLSLLCIFTILSVAARALSGNPESTVLFHIGLALFITALVVGVIRRGIHEVARSKSYEKLTFSIPSGICRIESFETGRIIFANEFYYRMFGYTEDEAKRAGFTTSDFTVLPEDLEDMKANNEKQVAAQAAQFETEARHVTKEGEIIWILARYRIDKAANEITVVMIDITDRKRAEEKLRISEEEYRIATQHSNKLIVRLDVQTKTTYRQADTPSVFGVPNVAEYVPESIIASGMVAPDSVETLRGFYGAIYDGQREGSAVISMYDTNAGEYRWYHFDFTSIFDDNGKPVQAVISFYDVTLLRQKELAFRRWQQSFNAIPKSSAMYYEYNLTSDVLEHEEGGMLPLIPDDVPRNLADVASYLAGRHIFPDDVRGWLEAMSRDRLLDRYAAGLFTDKIEFRRISGDTPLWTSLGIQLIPDPYSSVVKGYFLLEDIDEQKKTEIYLHERSTLDSLTGLYNRITFIEKFNDILSRSSPGTRHALIMLDIDNFKAINDTLGHNAGDALLAGIAGKLKFALRSDDLCGRLGGDEFVICLRNMNLGKPLETRVSDLCSLLSDEHTWGVKVSASFGIAGFPEDGLTFDELYQKADIALYKAKARGRGGFAFYDPQLSFDDLSIPVRHL
jgi:diguanylate cyclase (GGDEF)-like protein/PAS domain S-box-containing protein